MPRGVPQRYRGIPRWYVVTATPYPPAASRAAALNGGAHGALASSAITGEMEGHYKPSLGDFPSFDGPFPSATHELDEVGDFVKELELHMSGQSEQRCACGERSPRAT